jgi:23S rRNA (adenine1618-N6)-methyltransferase
MTDCFQLGNADVTEIGRNIDKTLFPLPLKWMWKPNISLGVGFTDKAVWSRASRRHSSKSQALEVAEDAALGFKIYAGTGDATADGTNITIRWLKGHDSVLFESLCGMIKRKLEEAK